MAVQITQWQAVDGALFSSKAACEDYELRQYLTENLLKMADRHDIEFDGDAVAMFFDFLVKEKDVLKAFLFPECP